MGRKLALIIGNSEYQDPKLAGLVKPGKDALGFAAVLRAPEIGGFDEVTPLINESEAVLRRTITRFFAQKKHDDLLLLYFSGHGVLDDQGGLYFAARDTEHDALSATAIPASFIRQEMDRSYSRRQVLILDCCHSGAFGRGSKGVGASVGTAAAFEVTGYGRAVLTATDSIQYAWEQAELVSEAEYSVFTHFLIDGLRTGTADNEGDGDGLVTLDELYDYVFAQVKAATPKQTPTRSIDRQAGPFVIARNPSPSIKPAKLSAELQRTIADSLTWVREGAIRELERLLNGDAPRLALAAHEALKHLAEGDDSLKVRAAAAAVLTAYAEAQRAKAEAQAKEEAVKKAEEEKARREAEERAQREAQAKAEAERSERAAQKAEREDAERLAREKAEAERKAKEEAEPRAAQKAEEERLAQERAEQERMAREKAEAERKAKEEAERRAAQKEEERAARGRAEQIQLAQERVLDAAIAKRVAIERATPLIVLIRRAESEGLRAMLQIDEAYSETGLVGDDVRSNPFQLEFPLNADGTLRSADLVLRIKAPDFEPNLLEKKIPIPSEGDSKPYTFLLTPKRTGELLLHLEVYKGDEYIASRILRTNGEAPKQDAPFVPSPPMLLVSIPLSLVGLPISPVAGLISQSGGININAQGEVNIGGDVVGRDKIVNQSVLTPIEEAERHAAQKEEERRAQERAEQERIARAKAERKAKEEAERLTAQKAEAERKAKEEAERLAAQGGVNVGQDVVGRDKIEVYAGGTVIIHSPPEKEGAERLAAQKEEERRAQERAEQAWMAHAKVEAERKAKEEAERLAAQKAEEERLAREKAEQERLAREKARQEAMTRERAERAERAAQKAEEERLARERAEQEQIARETAEAERKAKEEAEQRAAQKEEERRAQERAEQARLARAEAEAERKAREEAERQAAQAQPRPSRKLPVWGWAAGGVIALTLLVGGYALMASLLTQTPSIGSTRTREKDSMVEVYVPAGEFLMGSANSDSAASDDEKPQHQIYLNAYWIDQTEVTNAQFDRFVQVTGYQTDAEKGGFGIVFDPIAGRWNDTSGANWQHPRGPGSDLSGLDNHPVVQVSWNDAQAYCGWAGAQLPTEAQWEKTARGDNGQRYPWGDGNVAGNLLNFADRNLDVSWADTNVNDGYQFTAPVGSYPTGASPYGALDIAGNVWEWVADWYDANYYQNSPTTNSTGPGSGDYRVLRGGSWDYGAANVRAANRSRGSPVDRGGDIGFRCVR